MASYEDRLLRVVAYIHDNPAGDLSLDRLADIAAMSRFHWHRVFRAMTGETCAQAVRRVRLHRAAVWLVQTDRPLKQIAGDVGYPSLPSFSRVFQAAHGLSPGAFRTRGELSPPLLSAHRGDYPVYPIEINDQPARRLAAIPHKGPYIEIGKAFESVSAVFTSRGFWPQARGMVGVYFDDPDAVAAEELRSLAGIVVEGTLEVSDPLEEVNLPGGRYAVMHYKGPYSGLSAAYKHMYGVWLPESGEETGDHPPIEVYLNNPKDTAQDDLLTDVCVPLK
ncbi:AraC family transcriptional regulator [Rhodophyticola sp. CCM32]|uniref:AraC family transcriptional regulator n=1 Tax=Rhodophyticola sp. CCM32 TaxID=2916397 RepID=UPI00107F886E|nr:AraC family transcriptional regulator [Rhodophyticola sp. CCM32]QBY02794.1 AraC family transcriptional regulator [Rhodophyticola sp. CCM32]